MKVESERNLRLLSDLPFLLLLESERPSGEFSFAATGVWALNWRCCLSTCFS